MTAPSRNAMNETTIATTSTRVRRSIAAMLNPAWWRHSCAARRGPRSPGCGAAFDASAAAEPAAQQLDSRLQLRDRGLRDGRPPADPPQLGVHLGMGFAGVPSPEP